MQFGNLNLGKSTWLLVFLILYVWAHAANATKCHHCGRSGFAQLEKHAWRCKKTTQAQPPIEKQSRLVEKPQDRATVNNNFPHESPAATESNYIKCTCGKKCKGRKGLTMHQRSCKTHNSFQQNCKMTTELNNGENDTDEEQTIIDNEDNHASSQHGNTTTEFPAM